MVDPQSVEKLMQAAKAIGYGEVPSVQHGEGFTIGAYDLILISSADRGAAFTLLWAICEKYDMVKDDGKFLNGYVYLLRQLVAAADTTELPEGMEKIIKDNPAQTRELQEWYRIK